MPIAAMLALLLSVTWTRPIGEASVQQQIELEFFDPYGAAFQFQISQDAHIAIFEVGENQAALRYPSIGRELRRLRFGDETGLPQPDDIFKSQLAIERDGHRCMTGIDTARCADPPNDDSQFNARFRMLLNSRSLEAYACNLSGASP